MVPARLFLCLEWTWQFTSLYCVNELSLSKGKCDVRYQRAKQKDQHIKKLKLHDVFKVGKEDWHQIYNPYSEECRIIEIQYGDETSEDDIERLEFYKGNNDE